MLTTRRGALAGLGLLPLEAQARTRVEADPALVDPFTPELQTRLFRQPMPFLAAYRRGPLRLGFVAAVHSTDPKSATFATIRAAFGRIRPRRVVLEGFPAAWGDNPDKMVALISDHGDPDADAFTRGEAIHAAAQARMRQVPFAGGEMEEAELVNRLAAQGFAREDLLNVMLILVLQQDMGGGAFARPEGDAFEASFARWSRVLAGNYKVPAPDADAFRRWFAAQFGTDLRTDPVWFQKAWPGAAGLGGRIAQAQGVLRDRFLLGGIAAALNRAERVLVVYGGSHLATLWRGLAVMLGEPAIHPPPRA